MGKGYTNQLQQEGNLLVTKPEILGGRVMKIPLCLFISYLRLSRLRITMSTDEDLLLELNEGWGRPEFFSPSSIP